MELQAIFTTRIFQIDTHTFQYRIMIIYGNEFEIVLTIYWSGETDLEANSMDMGF